MKVLVVAKTHMRSAACVGGLALDENRNIRVLLSNGGNLPPDTPYQVGDIWELSYRPKRHVVPPHVEDAVVDSARRIGIQEEMREFLLSRIKSWEGGPECLFDGLLQFTSHGAGYLCREKSLPSGSVGFWQPAADLQADEHDGKLRYRYTSLRATVLIPYVGYEPPVRFLPRDSLLRVSLARWWRPDETPDMEERCYLQLSSWYAPNPVLRAQSPTKAYCIQEIRKQHGQAYAPWTAQDDDYLRERILDGATVDDLAWEFGRKPGGIRSRLRKLGLDTATSDAGSGISTWRKKRPRAGKVWTPEEDQALLRDVDLGVPLDSIATSLGRGLFSVQVRLHKLGRGSQLPTK